MFRSKVFVISVKQREREIENRSKYISVHMLRSRQAESKRERWEGGNIMNALTATATFLTLPSHNSTERQQSVQINFDSPRI